MAIRNTNLGNAISQSLKKDFQRELLVPDDLNDTFDVFYNSRYGA